MTETNFLNIFSDSSIPTRVNWVTGPGKLGTPGVMWADLSASQNSRAQFYKAFYCGNSPPFHGNAAILCYKAIFSLEITMEWLKIIILFKFRESRIKKLKLPR